MQHELYKSEDFTDDEYENSVIAKYVIDGGLDVCKNCSAGEIELIEYRTCGDFNARIRS